MILSEAITRVADDSKNDSSVSGVSERITREINRVCNDVWDGYAWTFRYRTYRIVMETDYETGSVTATNGSRTITGSGTTFESKHEGWYIYFKADSPLNWYKINNFTSTSQIELDVPYQGTTGSSKEYVLRKFDYILPTEIWDIEHMTASSDRIPMQILFGSQLSLVVPTPLYKGYPRAMAIYESDSKATTYSTGTVTGTVATTTLTGSGTSWLANVFPGDKVTIGDYDYRVRNVDTDTSLELYNYQQVASSGASYTITRQFGRKARIQWPASDPVTIEIRGLRKYVSLVNDNDTNELLYRYPGAVLSKVSALELKSKDDRRRRELEEEARIDLSTARAEDASLTPSESVATIHSYRNNRLRRYI